MKRSVRRQFVCSLAFIIALSASCATPPKPPKAVKTVAFITNTSSDFWKIARKGCEKADAELADVAVSFKTTNEGTTDEQNRLIRQALDRDEADAIAISPIDPAKQKSAINDAAKRALVITQDSDAPDTNRTLYLGADNRAAGRQAGELVLKALPQGGKIMVFVGNRDVQNARERFDGLKEALQGSKVEVIDLLADDSDPVHAMQNAADTMKKYPDIAGMVGLWSYNGPSILRALKSMDKMGKVKIVCFDDERETLEGIKDGSIFGTVAQQPFEYGYQAVQTAAKILRGDRSSIPASKTVFIPTVIIQRNNVEEYSKKLSQLLGSASG
ncbi:MAG TPA: sugar-binding protein [Pyrinomonadaceae bacterium]|jgi:ribose transport system substrate-binding protein|nr:sugar-binding protein [Pyrinomonadaceae bacterium]